ncbi:MAG TPA: FAD-dependent oxidoreductase [Candidatus Omnitrophota bacterium]|nr:FAD-dependent oxidoreductase [Candidatus Omnitrophota bacterium]
MDTLYDLIIAGAGPAGITASVYAARKRMSLSVLTGDIGGQTVWSGDIENYTGYQFISGVDLAGKLEEHIKQYSIEVREGETVTEVRKEGSKIHTFTSKGEYVSKTLIIASGKRSRELGVPGEKEFRSRGLAYCATCDGPLFAGKDVAVIGGGNSALEAAMQLIRIAKKVYIVNLAETLTGDAILIEKIERSGLVTLINGASVTAVKGGRFVESIDIAGRGRTETLSVQGVFVEIGLIPNTDFKSDIELNSKGEIKVDSGNRTNIPGIFAAGDVTDVPEKQIIIAAGEGAKAALSAFNHIARSKEWQ